MAVLVLLLLLLLCFLVSAVSSIFPTLGSGLANALSGTSYASEDTDLLGVDEDYTALENELAQTVANIESTHPGYDAVSYTHLDVYKRQIQSIATDGDPIGAIWGCVGYTVLLCFTLFKTGSLAKSIFGCH